MNLPNKLSTLRIILIPFFIFFYLASFVPYGKIIAVVIFILAAITDWFDGRIARKYNLVTNLGKLLDPIADKLLVVAGILLVVVDKTIPAPYGVIIAFLIIGRELLISALRQIAAANNYVMAADMFGKVKATVQDVALPLLFVLSFFMYDVAAGETLLLVWKIIAYVAIGLATVLTVLSGINYMVKNKNVLKG